MSILVEFHPESQESGRYLVALLTPRNRSSPTGWTDRFVIQTGGFMSAISSSVM